MMKPHAVFPIYKQKKWEYKKAEFAQTSIASETPGIDDISPPETLNSKSSFFCMQRHRKYD